MLSNALKEARQEGITARREQSASFLSPHSRSPVPPYTDPLPSSLCLRSPDSLDVQHIEALYSCVGGHVMTAFALGALVGFGTFLGTGRVQAFRLPHRLAFSTANTVATVGLYFNYNLDECSRSFLLHPTSDLARRTRQYIRTRIPDHPALRGAPSDDGPSGGTDPVKE